MSWGSALYGDGAKDMAGALARMLAGTAIEALSPTRCAGCERPGAVVCERCLERIDLIDPVTSCTACGAPWGSTLCTECRGEDPLARRCLAAASYTDPLPRIIRSYKDGPELRLAGVLSRLMADAARRAHADAPARYGGFLHDADAIVFVPATSSAFARRGFDHMEAVARSLSGITGVPVLDALAKHGSSDQRTAGRIGRKAMVDGVFSVIEDVGGLHLVVIDDVITTGSTLREASRSLAGAGAASVDALAVARVW